MLTEEEDERNEKETEPYWRFWQGKKIGPKSGKSEENLEASFTLPLLTGNPLLSFIMQITTLQELKCTS